MGLLRSTSNSVGSPTMHDSALPVAAGIRSHWQGSVAPLGSKCAKFGRAPRAQELTRGFGTGLPRSSHRLHDHSGQEFAGHLPCSPAPWSASDPVFSPGRPSGRLGCANNRRIPRDFKRVCEPLAADRQALRAANRRVIMARSGARPDLPGLPFAARRSALARPIGIAVVRDVAVSSPERAVCIRLTPRHRHESFLDRLSTGGPCAVRALAAAEPKAPVTVKELWADVDPRQDDLAAQAGAASGSRTESSIAT